MTDFELLEIQAATMFVTAGGRILRENDPDHSSGPRLYLGGCASGNIVRIRHDVDDKTARAVAALAAQEPPLIDADPRLGTSTNTSACSKPRSRYGSQRSDSSTTCPATSPMSSGGMCPLPFRRPRRGRLLSALAVQGMPEALVEVGFVAVTDFWEPWCVAFCAGEIASIAFAARLGLAGADTGLNTMPRFQGQGFGPAVTAAWASHPSLRERTLFYSTDRTNRASRRVAEKLGLWFIGASRSWRRARLSRDRDRDTVSASPGSVW